MRIIAGEFRGRSLESVRDLSVRPTTDRAKQTIFDILSNRIEFDGLDVLDLFAGSGSLGLEALSRGVKSVTFIDNSTQIVGCAGEECSFARMRVAVLGISGGCILVSEEYKSYV
jgi:16S rRNA (guanine966-N2)-methyltransferase